MGVTGAALATRTVCRAVRRRTLWQNLVCSVHWQYTQRRGRFWRRATGGCRRERRWGKRRRTNQEGMVRPVVAGACPRCPRALSWRRSRLRRVAANTVGT